MLRGINEEKKGVRSSKGKTVHDFFLPPGSKILVCSYVNLRREGMDGYIMEFNNIVRVVYGVTGDVGVEMLPVCPVVFEGLDMKGGGADLSAAELDWMGWGENGKKSCGEAGCNRGGGGRVRW